MLDLELAKGKVANVRYRLLPVFSELLKPDPAMQTLIDKIREPHAAALARRSPPPTACSIAAAISAAAWTS